MTVQNTNLKTGGQSVGEEEDVLIAQTLRNQVNRSLSVRNTHVLRLGTVNHVTENPADTTNGLAVRRLVRLTVGALTAAGHGGNNDAVADLQVSHRGANLGNGTDSLVAQDASVVHLGAVALQDVQVSTANGGGVDTGDNVRGLKNGGVRDFLPGALLIGTVVHICLHGDSFVEALMRVQ